jgi:hypothetical protein
MDTVTITIPDIMLRSISYLKQYVSETGFCLRLQVGPADRLALFIGPT